MHKSQKVVYLAIRVENLEAVLYHVHRPWSAVIQISMLYMQAWRTNHYPKRNNWFRRPKIHTGFDKAWRNNGLNEKVLDKIRELFLTKQIDKDEVEFVVTGKLRSVADFISVSQDGLCNRDAGLDKQTGSL